MSRRGGRRIGSNRALSRRNVQPIWAVGPFTGANYYATASGGGEAGVGTGFGSLSFVVIDTPGGSQFLQNRSNSGGSNGHLFFLNGTTLAFLAGSGVPAAVQSNTVTITAGMQARPLAIMGWHTGSALRLAVDAFPAAAGTAITGYTAFANTFTVSGVAGTPGTAPATGVKYLGGLTWRGTPTDAQLSHLMSLFNTSLRVPTQAAWDSISGTTAATITHRWSVQESVSSPVAGATGPASIADSITAAGGDALTRAGTPVLSVVGYR